MSRFPSIKHAPSETRRFLRDRFNRKLGTPRQIRHLAENEEVMSDQLMLRLLQGLDITFEADCARAEASYGAANPADDEPMNLQALADAGWVRVIWGRVAIARDIRRAARQASASSMTAFETLLNRIHDMVFQGSAVIKSEVDLFALVSSIETKHKDPYQITCPTPSWVAGRLWELKPAGNEGATSYLRRWVDLWRLLQNPALVPGDVWSQDDAESFRMAAMTVISSEPVFGDWPETRDAYIRQAALVNNVAFTDVESHFPEIPVTLVGSALWLDHPSIDHSFNEYSYRSCGDVFGLVGILLADVVASDHARAPHPMAVRLIDLAINRAELFIILLFQVRAHPTLLADLVLHPPSTALACLLVAQWQSPTSAWERNLAERDNRNAQVEAFADAVAILGEYLGEGKVAPAEAAALLNWFHEKAGPGFIDATAGDSVLLESLRRELAGVPKATQLAIAESLYGPELQLGLRASEFAAILDLVVLGGLAADLEPGRVVDAYVQSIHEGEYSLSAHRVGVAGAAALAQLAARTPDLHQAFLYPLQVRERLAAATVDDNPYTLADSIGRSIRAHIRILSRAVVGCRENISGALVDALVAAVRAGALEHKEKGRVAAFAPRFEQSIVGPTRDRPLAADLGAALDAMSSEQQATLLDAVLETDEPLILAQLLSFSPPKLRARIERRITALAPLDAGNIQSLTEMQARIDELLTAGAADAASRYMEAEAELKTWGKPPGRELARFRNQLRLHYLREDWPAILSTPRPAFKAPLDQASAEETLSLFRGIAALKGPTPDPEYARRVFADLFERRPTAGYATNWFAAECSRLLQADSFGLLKGADVQEGRRALAELKRMASAVPSGQIWDEEMETNKALLLLALDEPSQALAVVTSAPLVRLQDTAAAYRAMALARLGRSAEAIAVLDAAEHTHGVTPLLAAARGNIIDGAGFRSAPGVSVDDDRLRNVAWAVAQFRTMNPRDQAQVLDVRTDSFEGLVVDHVRAAAGSVVSLVPMMRGVSIDTYEDDLTAFIQHILAARVHFLGWFVADQSRGGFSAKENPGERDLKLMWGGADLALIEAVVCNHSLNQDSMRANLESHFQKLLGYGSPVLFFHLTYASIPDLAGLMTFLEGAAELATPPGFTFKGRQPIPHTDSRPPGFVARYDADFGEVKVIFLVLNLGQPPADIGRVPGQSRRAEAGGRTDGGGQPAAFRPRRPTDGGQFLEDGRDHGCRHHPHRGRPGDLRVRGG